MAITSSGEVVVGLGYAMDMRTVAGLLKAVSTTRLKRGQRFYLGVVLDRKRRSHALRQLDDAAAETAALSRVGDSRRKRSGV